MAQTEKYAQIPWQGMCEGGGLEPPSRSITRPQATKSPISLGEIGDFARGCCILGQSHKAVISM